ncbi:FMN adenylyltransferase [Kwoniella heveanensis BCC8398]|uniref:FAD synthase n=1 Tax=Kwoniella heveanensis BCC8398 TaxID=1296120 RepID=A0A1B9GQ62_9TREE|nr:FMN adenylyltransferase [Kwoniella heveanensis BCC8398]
MSAGSSSQAAVAPPQSSSNAPGQPIKSPPPPPAGSSEPQSSSSAATRDPSSSSRVDHYTPDGDGSSYRAAASSPSLSSSATLPYPDIRSIYITAPYPFPELDGFVLDCTKRYKMDLYRFGGGMKAALTEWLGCGGGRGVKGVLVGTRKGDPNDNVEVLAPTDPSWPQFLRVHPILHWTYADVWNFLLELHVPYCSLYDEGYTSLGSTTNTSPNPLLRNPSSSTGWDPAFKLQDASQERAGRH